jgi:hypothetical protein
MGDIKLDTPRLRIVREGQPDLELQTINADLVLWDRTRFRHKWPPMSEAPFLWLTFISWAAARRIGAAGDSATYEAWESDVLEVEVLTDDDDGEGAEIGRPTPWVPAPD